MSNKNYEEVTLTEKELKNMIEKEVENQQPKLIGDDPEPAESEKGFPTPMRKKDVDKQGLPVNEFSFVRFAKQRDERNFTGREAEVLAETKDTPLSWADGSSGGYWVGSEFLPNEFIENYRANQVCRQAGCMVLPCSGAPINIPKSTGSVTVSWYGQNASITKTDATPNQLQLSPKIAAGRTQISQTLASLSPRAAETIIRNDLSEGLGLAIDNAILEGTGTSNQPTGMANTSGINTVAASNAAITLDLLRDMEYKLQADNCKFKKPAFIMNPRTWHAVQELTVNSETHHYILNPGVQEATVKKLFGYPVYLSTQVSISNSSTDSDDDHANIFLADMADVVLAEWGGIRLDSTETGGDAWAEFAVEFRGSVAVDVGVRNAESICLINDTPS